MRKFIVISIVLLMLAGFAITSSAEDLVVGRELITVGTLTVVESGGVLVVTYNIPNDPVLEYPEWELLETHLYVGWTNPAEEVLNSAPGQFPYYAEHDSENPTFTVIYEIPISEIDSYKLKGGKKWVVDDEGEPGEIYIAAHAEIGMIDEDGKPVLDNLDPLIGEQIEETTWAEGTEIRSEKNWAMYFEFVIPEP
jgi:hypothetical protein